MKVVTFAIALSLLLAACTPIQPGAAPTPLPATPPSAETQPANTPESAPETTSEDPLAGTQWVLQSLGTVGAESATVGETPVTLEFSNDGQVGGNAGCNSYGGSYQVDGNTLAFGEIISTLMACVDTAQMDQEIAYLEALQTISGFQIEGDRLILNYNDGQGVLNFVSVSATPNEEEAPATETPAPEAAAPNSPLDMPVTDSAANNSQDFIWTCYTCRLTSLWNFENGQATQIEAPVEIEWFWGYASATGRILYSSPLPMLGLGPSPVSVHNLWTADIASGQAEPIFREQNIVEALWVPDGKQFAYIRATDTTHELHWRGLNGEDKLLASDVAFTFNISPNGDKVAFMRESGYGLPVQPGLYVVDVATAAETMLSDIDRAGSGSIDDKLAWSPSGQYVLLPTNATPDDPGGMIRAAIDGSSTVMITFDPALAEESWYEAAPQDPFWIADNLVIAAAFVNGVNQPMSDSTSLILYQLNDTLDTIVDGTVITDEGWLVDWDVPGSSVWVQTRDGMQSMPLPTL